MLLPFARFRSTWDIVVLLLVCYTGVSLPIFLAYPVQVFEVISWFELIMDCIFLVDIGLNFRTAVVQVLTLPPSLAPSQRASSLAHTSPTLLLRTRCLSPKRS